MWMKSNVPAGIGWGLNDHYNMPARPPADWSLSKHRFCCMWCKGGKQGRPKVGPFYTTDYLMNVRVSKSWITQLSHLWVSFHDQCK